MAAKQKTVAARVAEFLSRNIDPPRTVQNPETGEVFIDPAKYSFSGPHAAEFERIAAGASGASGIVPAPEELTAELMAKVQAAQQQAPT